MGKCLSSVQRILKGIRSEIMFVADRCTDNTMEIVKKFNVISIIEKNVKIAKKGKSLEEDC